ncbi:peptide chain release factor N(5)-glutamine methyltransferase [Fulvivirga sedimenti]|uniref:Release factor glutamine methyltransferase n=1 Tax=Fulvivirga sedimenti TaxID=2879465 RepID=A0A9X1HTX7_9BACT|nr:peptide chain release factor N(5)-glutamine methyltransferase [Fulvivirga sedimenti]MCA6078253.1 peptide chain release factor N(5)-glutamine methyltransferase [Fulvivirga sedimenti]
MAQGIPDSSKKLFEFVRDNINTDGNQREAEAKSYLILEHLLKVDRNDIILDRSVTLLAEKSKTLLKYIDRINQGEPVQYILGEGYFYGRPFIVNSNVLIPRSETEELIELILNENPDKRLRVFDVGTGTGCIPITLAKERPGLKCFALDFSPRALKVARQNAERYNVSIEFFLIDILKEGIPVDHLDVVVSNPPYITRKEMEHLERTVKDFEPHTALFIPDEDPILFYRHIAARAAARLKPKGRIYFEINEEYGADVSKCLVENRFQNIKIIKDIHGKDRFVRGEKSI